MKISINNFKLSADTMLPIIVACSGYAIYNCVDVILKLASANLHVSQILCFAYGSQLIIALIYGLFFNKGKAFKSSQKELLFIRSSVSGIGTILGVTALVHLKLASFYTIVFTAPLWVAILSALVLKDKIGKNKIIAVSVGFCSILYMFRPSSGIFNVWSCMMLGAAFITAVDLLLVRRLGSKENKVNIFVAGCAVGLLLNLPILYFHYVPFGVREIVLLTISSLISMVAFLCIIFAYQMASSAALVAPFNYTQIIWGSVLGYLVFGEVPSHSTIIGSAAIIASGIYLMISEHRLNKKAREQRPTRSTVY